MLTGFGRFVRKLRIDHGELLKDMAGKLNVSAAFLSAVETGKKSVPATWVEVLVKQYGLDRTQRGELLRAVDESQTAVKIDLAKASAAQRSFAVAFARDFDKLSDAQLKAFRQMLGSTSKKEH